MTSPTQRSLALLRKRGMDAEVVERWIPQAGIRKDLFGVIDIVALNEKVIGVQTTSSSNLSARQHKCEDSPRLAAWLRAGALFELHGWSLKGRAGKRKTYQVRILQAELGPHGILFRDEDWQFKPAVAA